MGKRERPGLGDGEAPGGGRWASLEGDIKQRLEGKGSVAMLASRKSAVSRRGSEPGGQKGRGSTKRERVMWGSAGHCEDTVF